MALWFLGRPQPFTPCCPHKAPSPASTNVTNPRLVSDRVLTAPELAEVSEEGDPLDDAVEDSLACCDSITDATDTPVLLMHSFKGSRVAFAVKTISAHCHQY